MYKNKFSFALSGILLLGLSFSLIPTAHATPIWSKPSLPTQLSISASNMTVGVKTKIVMKNTSAATCGGEFITSGMTYNLEPQKIGANGTASWDFTPASKNVGPATIKGYCGGASQTKTIYINKKETSSAPSTGEDSFESSDWPSTRAQDRKYISYIKEYLPGVYEKAPDRSGYIYIGKFMCHLIQREGTISYADNVLTEYLNGAAESAGVLIIVATMAYCPQYNDAALSYYEIKYP